MKNKEEDKKIEVASKKGKPTPIRGTLYVVTCLEKAMTFIFDALNRAPKKFRYSIVCKIENSLLDCLEKVIKANLIELGKEDRRKYQDEVEALLICTQSLLRIAYQLKAIPMNIYEEAVKEIDDALLYLKKWIVSDEKRIAEKKNNCLS